ncbi:unnamed protein product [Ectocarpus sp. 12 AP-2014]
MYASNTTAWHTTTRQLRMPTAMEPATSPFGNYRPPDLTVCLSAFCWIMVRSCLINAHLSRTSYVDYTRIFRCSCDRNFYFCSCAAAHTSSWAGVLYTRQL